MGGNQKQDKANSGENVKEKHRGFREYIDHLYDEAISLGYLYVDLNKMDLYELENLITQRRKGLAYEIWKIASLTRHPMVENFPETPEEACPELYPEPKGIPMPECLKEKVARRGGGQI